MSFKLFSWFSHSFLLLFRFYSFLMARITIHKWAANGSWFSLCLLHFLSTLIFFLSSLGDCVTLQVIRLSFAFRLFIAIFNDKTPTRIRMTHGDSLSCWLKQIIYHAERAHPTQHSAFTPTQTTMTLHTRQLHNFPLLSSNKSSQQRARV